jgi:NADH dehydrogenase [ubiquinone] 1 alpha subcomplex assembly factor 1
MIDSTRMNLTLFDFTDSATLQSWFVVDDGVMGGRSRGTLEFGGNGITRFSGIVRLDNNGGFSSIQTRFRPLDVSRYTGIELRLRGDGKRYGLFLRNNFSPLVYQKNFHTDADVWRDIRIPFAELRPDWYGYPVQATPLNLHHIMAMSIIVPDKQAGSFMLDLKHLGIYQDRYVTILSSTE